MTLNEILERLELLRWLSELKTKDVPTWVNHQDTIPKLEKILWVSLKEAR